MTCSICGHENPSVYAFCEECGANMSASPEPSDVANPDPVPESDADVGSADESLVADSGTESNTVLCEACDYANPATYRFCEACGATLAPPVAATAVASLPEAAVVAATPCSSCGFGNRSGISFCEACGTRIGAMGTNVTAAQLPQNAQAESRPGEQRPRRRKLAPALAALVLVTGAGVAVAQSDWFSSDSRAEDTSAYSDTTTAPTTTEASAAPTTAGTPGATATTRPSSATTTQASSTSSPTDTPTDTPTDATDPLPDIPAEILAALGQDSGPAPGSAEYQVEPASPVFQLTSQSFTGDDDLDGLSNAMEQRLADFFSPVYVFDEEEPYCLDPYTGFAVPWQATPSNAKPRWQGGTSSPIVTKPPETEYYDTAPYAVLSFVASYTSDCGAFSIEALHGHPGDSEGVYVVVQHTGDRWVPIELAIKRHYEDMHLYAWSDLRVESGPNGESHPYIWVSEGKHASYISASECEKNPVHVSKDQVGDQGWLADAINWGLEHPDRILGFDVLGNLTFGAVDIPLSCTEWEWGIGLCLEDCGGLNPPLRAYTPFSMNVGEVGSGRQAFDAISDSGSSWLRNLFGGEYAWSDTKFCGRSYRSSNRNDCAGSLQGKWARSERWEKLVTTVVVQDPAAAIASTYWTFSSGLSPSDGPVLHVDFTVDNHMTRLDVEVVVDIYTFDASNTEVRAYTFGRNEFHDGTMGLSASDARPLLGSDIATTNPAWDSNRWEGFKVEIPYSEFFPYPKNYYAVVQIIGPDTGSGWRKTLATARTPNMYVRRVSTLNGRWYSNINGGWTYDIGPLSGSDTIYLWDVVGVDEIGQYRFTGNGYELATSWNNGIGGSGSGWAVVTAVNESGVPIRIDGMTGPYSSEPSFNGSYMYRN